MARCYHRQCGRTFSGLSAFDRHLRLLREHPWTACDDPSIRGLEERDGVWGGAPPEKAFRRLDATPLTAGGNRG